MSDTTQTKPAAKLPPVISKPATPVPPVVVAKDYAHIFNKKREAYIATYAGKPNRNPYIYLTKHFNSVSVDILMGKKLTPEQCASIEAEWPVPVV